MTIDVIQVWMTSLAVHSFGTWTCYVADTNGGIEVLKKGPEDNEIERLVTLYYTSIIHYTTIILLYYYTILLIPLPSLHCTTLLHYTSILLYITLLYC